MNSKEIRDQIASLKDSLVKVEASLRAKTVRHFVRVAPNSTRRYLRTSIEPAPVRSHPWTKAQESRRFALLAEIKRLQASLPPLARLAPFFQDPSRPTHPDFGKKACRKHPSRKRFQLKSGRRFAPADRLDIATIWAGQGSRDIVEPLFREASIEELQGQSFISGRSVLRPLKIEPKRPRKAKKPPRKAFEKVFRNIPGPPPKPFPCATCKQKGKVMVKGLKCRTCLALPKEENV